MLFRQEFLDGIRSGSITLAFRRWRRPSVRAGGTLLTAVGQIDIGAVDRIAAAQISTDDARRAGYTSREALLNELDERAGGHLFRIELKSVRPDPRVALRERLPDEAARVALLRRLDRLDARASGGAWTSRVLELIARHTGVRAGDLCRLAGMTKDDFKINVRKLKALGLTDSLDTGYRLSPRGHAVCAARKEAHRS